VTIEHELPGRLRARLSHAVRDLPQLRRMLLDHPGVRIGIPHEYGEERPLAVT
jgi:hypothetical protein